ncbi:thioredoxin fold domain-containing protein [Morganella psychrotolerans]|uniref:thioredoxin fold domain-containing protein n=1 Tax=Morganella psychrotolerans TaxID=368603 RepID=UPI0039AF74D5
MILLNKKGTWLTVSREAEQKITVLSHFDRKKYSSFTASESVVVCSGEAGTELRIKLENADEVNMVLDYIQNMPFRVGVLAESKVIDTMTAVFLLLTVIYVTLFIGNSTIANQKPVLSVAPMPSGTVNSVIPAIVAPVVSEGIPDDGWSLPETIRNTLPNKLQNAAQSGIFTIPYSSGHERTLYVFADPRCPNCQRLEPALNQAAKTVNVVVFPVSVIGKDKSAEDIISTLCLPAEQRKAAWDAMTDITAEQREIIGCEIGQKALAVNEVAFRTYQIPGTPWVIADDGRYVPQNILNSPALLKQFLEH